MSTKSTFIKSLGSLFDLSDRKNSHFESLGKYNTFDIEYEQHALNVSEAWKETSDLIGEAYFTLNPIQSKTFYLAKAKAMSKNTVAYFNLSENFSLDAIEEQLLEDSLVDNCVHLKKSVKTTHFRTKR